MSHRLLASPSQEEEHLTSSTTMYNSISMPRNNQRSNNNNHDDDGAVMDNIIIYPSSWNRLPSRLVATGLMIMAVVFVGSAILHSSSAMTSKGENKQLLSSSNALRMEQKVSMKTAPLEGRSWHYDRPRQQEESDMSVLASGGQQDDAIRSDYVGPRPQASTSSSKWLVHQRCDWVVGVFTEKYDGKSDKKLRVQYAVQSVDPNVFYRATANIFWIDFVKHGWGDLLQFENIGIKPVQMDGTPLQPKSTWTWITGDQHLSNFGAWRNRHRDVVFSVNDFDEAAVYDFQVDVLRIAVSVCSHAFTNNLPKEQIDFVLRAFTDTYIETLLNYVGSDRELLFELTPSTSTSVLKDFLEDLKEGKSVTGQLEKFTELPNDGSSRRFIKTEDTKLEPVNEATLQKIREQFTKENFGSTMMKVGWHVRDWDDDFFEVLDVAARVGSGVGSYGVARYYILLKGTDDALDDGTDGNAVILDVKYEPPGAVSGVLNEEDTAWYNTMFVNDAHRAVEGQRRLTSYVDPFTGWVILDDKPFVVRQRSPWKSGYDLSSLTAPDDFIDFMEQIAVATATSHARGSLAKSPGQFKHVISGALRHWADRKTWGDAIATVAYDYREQVLLDFQCFKDWVDENYS